MTFRAKQEKMKHDLSVNFYYGNLCSGCSYFFGVYHNNKNISHDIQNPEAYKEFVGHKKSSNLDKEYINVPFGQMCHVPLIQTTKLLGIKKEDLPTIQTSAIGLESNFRWLESEKKTKGLFIYNHHIENTKDHLIETYPEIKVKLHKQFKPKHSGFNPTYKCEEVFAFIDSAIILELNHMMDRLGGRPAILERTLH